MRLTKDLLLDQLVCPSSSRVHPNLDQGTWIKCPQGILDHEPASCSKTPDSSIPDPASAMAQGPVAQDLEKKLVARARDLNPESQIRLEYYLAHFHASLDYESEIHVHSIDEPDAKPAVMSLRPRGRVQGSEAIPLGELREILGMPIVEGEAEEESAVSQLTISTTSSESEEGLDRGEEGVKNLTPQLQHIPEQTLSGGLQAIPDCPLPEEEICDESTSIPMKEEQGAGDQPGTGELCRRVN